jgi:EAL domain-containing protein (putative c-di-GMP-specific phosphodiesterase class I)
LCDSGADFVQGYYIARPAPAMSLGEAVSTAYSN